MTDQFAHLTQHDIDHILTAVVEHHAFEYDLDVADVTAELLSASPGGRSGTARVGGFVPVYRWTLDANDDDVDVRQEAT